MSAVTKYRDGRDVYDEKGFSWSFSRLKNYEICPKRYYEVDVKKRAKDKSDALEWGDRVHKAASDFLMYGNALPPDILPVLGPWVGKIKQTPGDITVEQKFAITEQLQPTTYFGDKAWVRAVADVLKVQDEVALAIDWKTGKIQKDSVQLGIIATCVFAHHPKIQTIRTEFIWLAADATTREDFTRASLDQFWLNLRSRVHTMKQSHDTNTFTEKPNKFCGEWCPVTACQHHGKRY